MNPADPAPHTAARANASMKALTIIVVVGLAIGAAAVVWLLSSSFGSSRALVASLAALVVTVLVVGVLVGSHRLNDRAILAALEVAAGFDVYPDSGPTSAHEPLVPAVLDLEALGYRRDCITTTPDGIPLVLMGHADGSVATVAWARPFGKVRPSVNVSLHTCLLPGRCWLRTAVAANSHVGPALLVDGCGPGSAPTDLAARHHEARAALHRWGVGWVPVLPGGTADDNAARRRALVGDARSAHPIPGGAARTWALLDDPALPAAAERIALLQPGSRLP